MPSSQHQNSDEPSGLLRTLLAAFSVVLFGLFLSRFKTPRNNPTETNSGTIYPQDNAKPKERLGVSQASVAAQTPPTPTQQYYPDRRKDNTPKWKKRIEISAVIIAGVLMVANIFVTIGTWKAANAAKHAAESAERQRISFENSQRGQLTIENFHYGFGDANVHFELWNRGNSSIKEIGESGPTGFGFEWVTFGDGGMADLLRKWQVHAKPNWRGFSLPPGEHQSFDVPTLSVAERRSHRPPEEIALFFGRIYTGIDIFGHEQSAVICIQSLKGGYARCLSNPEQQK
jgi:hypothetical protein